MILENIGSVVSLSHNFFSILVDLTIDNSDILFIVHSQNHCHLLMN